MNAALFLCALALAAASMPAFGQGKAPQSATSGMASCASCHGAKGEGNAQGGFPRLAGQPAEYLLKQLNAYADGKRENPVMSPIAKQMSAQERSAAAALYAGMPVTTARLQKPAAKTSARGRTLATTGDQKRQVQACANCHGPDGAGIPPIPALAGQPLSFLASSLQQWKSGARQTDASQQMPAVAKALSDADIQAVAGYYAALPAPQGSRTSQPAKPSAPQQGAKGSPPSSGKPPATGVDQGAPTTGGATGPGGPSTNAPGKAP